jgi:DNA-binding NarL/FixJ family response regulator
MSETEGSSTRKKIFILDDHAVIRELLGDFLETQGDFAYCGGADTAAGALEAIQRTMPDLVIVDISLKAGRNGLEFTKDVRSIYPALPLLVFSMHDEALYAERVLRAGANGYVSKNEPAQTIVDAIRHVLGGEVYVSKQTSKLMINHFLRGAAEHSTSSVQRLTDRELEVFELVGRGKTTSQISSDLNLTSKTVETYRGRIKAKLGLSSATELHQQALQWTLENHR